MTTMTMKRKPAELDLTSVQRLDDLPAVAAAALAARAARSDFDALSAQWTALERRTQGSDRLAQIEAGIELAKIAPALHVAELKAMATRRVSDEARTAARAAILDAHGAEYADRMKRVSAKYVEAETEARELLVWLDQLAGVAGHAGLVSHWIAAVPVGLRPGGHAEWSALLPTAVGVDVR